jgi:hypothetical protein
MRRRDTPRRFCVIEAVIIAVLLVILAVRHG